MAFEPADALVTGGIPVVAPPFGDNLWAALADDLARNGWVRLPDWPQAELTAALKARVVWLEAEDRIREAGVGPAAHLVVDKSQRRAAIHWLGPDDPVEARFLAQAEGMRLALNAQLFLGLFSFECCFAVYPPGGFYKRHFDSFRGARNRVVSLVTYLNDGWNPVDGGELLIYDPATGVPTSILPEAGTSILMLSEETEHEVRTCAAPRYAIAGWWRVNEGV